MILEGRPLKGKELVNLKQFLNRMELKYEDEIEYSICILDNDSYKIIGTGSVEQNVIKCLAIDPLHQGKGLASIIISSLVQYSFEKEVTHLFIYTKPKNQKLLAEMGFYRILMTEDILFMENRQEGFSSFLKQLLEETPSEALEHKKQIGAVVANCDPFTKGHRYLIESALKKCDYLHLFILSDDRGRFRAKQRYEMVKEGIRGLDNVILHHTSDYMISSATFPTYFFKDKVQGQRANCKLDLELFVKKIAPELRITKRFVGTEPMCRITNSYNEEMKKWLPLHGIYVEEIQRKELKGKPISASEVRHFLKEKQYTKIKELVPEQVYGILMKINGGWS